MRRRALALLLVTAACARLPEPPADLPQGDAVLRLVPEKTEVALGERVALRAWLRVKAEVEPPDLVAKLRATEHLRLAAADEGRWQQRGAERFWTRAYTVQWLRKGPRTLPEVEHAGATSEAIDFEVKPALPADATPQAELPADAVLDPPPPPFWPWIAGTAALAALVWAFLRWRRRRALAPEPLRARVMVPPDQLALARLKELERMLEAGEIGGERLVVEVSAALRRWLQHGLGLVALERTTEEFLHGLGSGAHLPAEQRSLLAAFLRQCDLVKFAAQRLDLAQCRALLGAARDFVLATAKPAGAAPQPALATAEAASG